MQKVNTFFKNLWNDESGQGMTEYALLLVIVIAVAAAFKTPILNAIKEKMGTISGDIQKFDGN